MTQSNHAIRVVVAYLFPRGFWSVEKAAEGRLRTSIHKSIGKMIPLKKLSAKRLGSAGKKKNSIAAAVEIHKTGDSAGNTTPFNTFLVSISVFNEHVC